MSRLTAGRQRPIRIVDLKKTSSPPTAVTSVVAIAATISFTLGGLFLALVGGYFGLTLAGSVAALLNVVFARKRVLATAVSIGFSFGLTATLFAFDVTAWRGSSLPPLAAVASLAGLSVWRLGSAGARRSGLLTAATTILIISSTLLADIALFKVPIG